MKAILRNRQSTRLRGFDYSEPGEYFVTMCTKDRVCSLGKVCDAAIRLSDIGRIVENFWKEIRGHFPNTKVSTYQIMPNHVHGIVEIVETKPPDGTRDAVSRQHNSPGDHIEIAETCSGLTRSNQIHGAGELAETRSGLVNQTRTDKAEGETPPEQLVGTRHAVSQQEKKVERFGKPVPGSLSTIIRSFEGAVSMRAHAIGFTPQRSIWQPRFYDHIIRNNVEHFMIQQYIELNPLFWEYNIDNPRSKSISHEEFERILRERFDIHGIALHVIMSSKKMDRIKLEKLGNNRRKLQQKREKNAKSERSKLKTNSKSQKLEIRNRFSYFLLRAFVRVSVF